VRAAKLVSSFVFAATTLLACSAAAEGAQAFDAGVLAGYGVSSGVDVIGAGLGARLGYLSEIGLYAGAIGLVHFGSTDPGEPDVRHYSESIRLELGYEVEVEPLAFRPALRGGLTHVTTPRDLDGSFWSPDVGLGATLLVPLDGPFLGFDVDARLLTRLADGGDTLFSITSIAGYWLLGYRF
jgi:hypothetical protein